VEDTWGARDIPVLRSVVELLDHSYMVTVSDIAGRTGLELAEVARSLEAMDPTYVDFRKTETGGDPTFWYVNKVTPEARQAVGQWPTAEGLVDRLVQAFSVAADREQDAERHYQLRQAAGLLGETIHDVAVQVAASITGPWPASAPAAGAAQSAVARSDAAQPDATLPGAAWPGAAQSDAAQPDAAQPDAAQPGAARPGPVRLGTVQLDAVQSDGGPPEAGEPRLEGSG
jgi:hypothetical protein